MSLRPTGLEPVASSCEVRLISWWGWRDSNPRLPPSQGGTLNPLSYIPMFTKQTRRMNPGDCPLLVRRVIRFWSIFHRVWPCLSRTDTSSIPADVRCVKSRTRKIEYTYLQTSCGIPWVKSLGDACCCEGLCSLPRIADTVHKIVSRVQVNPLTFSASDAIIEKE